MHVTSFSTPQEVYSSSSEQAGNPTQKINYLKCSVWGCGTKFKSKEALKNHINGYHKINSNAPHVVVDKLYKCTLCHFSYHALKYLVMHSRDRHQCNPVVYSAHQSESNFNEMIHKYITVRVTCPVIHCEKPLASYSSLSIHLINTHLFTALKTREIITAQKEGKIVKIAAPPKLRFYCPANDGSTCPVTTSCKSTMTTHLERYHAMSRKVAIAFANKLKGVSLYEIQTSSERKRALTSMDITVKRRILESQVNSESVSTEDQADVFDLNEWLSQDQSEDLKGDAKTSGQTALELKESEISPTDADLEKWFSLLEQKKDKN